MTNIKIFFILLFVCKYSECSLRGTIHARVTRLRERAKRMYGNVSKTETKLWELELEDRLSYPRGDRHKLSEISEHWVNYYACCARWLAHVTPSGAMPVVSLATLEGATARLPCGLCIPPGGRDVTWQYAESLYNLTFLPMEEKETAVLEQDGNMTIYHVQSTDAGVYRCTLGNSTGALVALEVVDQEEDYALVKPPTSHGPFPSPPLSVGDLTTFTSWSAWSDCSRCGRVGRRRRYGVCQVKLRKQKRKEINFDSLCPEGKLLLQEFPEGVWCRSRYLPTCARLLPARRSELMIAMCKVPCEDIVFKIRSTNGTVFERANNSADVYSFAQQPPVQPPPPAREIVFAERGKPIVIRCPGTTLRDMPVSWRIGTKLVVPRDLDHASGGRLRVNARDHLVFSSVQDSDANLYSCWQGDNLAGSVRVRVWRGHYARTPTVLLALLVTMVYFTKLKMKILY